MFKTNVKSSILPTSNGRSEEIKPAHSKSFYSDSFGTSSSSELKSRYIGFMPNLPTDIDIFNCLPDYVYKNSVVNCFLNGLKGAIFKYMKAGWLANITLPKLHVSEHTNNSITIDWVFSYFRLFFSFDTEEGNYYGIVIIDEIQKNYSSDVREIDENECEEFTEVLLQNVLNMMNYT